MAIHGVNDPGAPMSDQILPSRGAVNSSHLPQPLGSSTISSGLYMNPWTNIGKRSSFLPFSSLNGDSDRLFTQLSSKDVGGATSIDNVYNNNIWCLFNNNVVNASSSPFPSLCINNYESSLSASFLRNYEYNYPSYRNCERGEASTSTFARPANFGPFYSSMGTSRNNIYCASTDMSLEGRVVRPTRSHPECPLMYERVKRGLPEEWRILILNEAREDFEGLASNEHGRVLLYGIIECGRPYEIQQLVDAMINMNQLSLVGMCMSEEGMQLVQVLINEMMDQQQYSFALALLRQSHLLTMDKNGSIIVSMCISHFDAEYTLGIVCMLMEHCVGLAKHKHGCHVLQNCFKKYADDQRILSSFLDNLIGDVANLASHAYGNFVIQCLIRMNIQNGVSLVVSRIMDYIIELSMDKYGSHFMETCIEISTEPDLDRIIYCLMDSDHFVDVLQDDVGNFVAQRAIRRASKVKGNTFRDFYNQIMSMYSSLQSHPFGARVLDTLKHYKQKRFLGNQG